MIQTVITPVDATRDQPDLEAVVSDVEIVPCFVVLNKGALLQTSKTSGCDQGSGGSRRRDCPLLRGTEQGAPCFRRGCDQDHPASGT